MTERFQTQEGPQKSVIIMQGQDDMLAQVSGHNMNMSKLIQTLLTRFALSAFSGSFNMTATATITVADANVKKNSLFIFLPTNAVAARLQGSAQQLYVSAQTAGVNFVASTGNAVAAAGTETFSYLIVNVG
jgi:hypothetical protein